MPADPVLSAMYGTPVEAQPEQTTDAEMIDKISSALDEQSIDFDALTDVEKDELIGAAIAEEQPGETEADEATKEAEAKLIEADTMGRVMAHAMHQELGEIEKGAAKGSSAEKNLAKAQSAAVKGKMTYKQKAGTLGRQVMGAKGSKQRAVAAHLAKFKGRYGAGAAALGAGAGGYALAKKSADEEAQAEFDAAVGDAAAEQAAQILTDMGVTPDQIPE